MEIEILKYGLQIAGIIVTIILTTNRNRKELEHRLTRIETLLDTLPCKNGQCKSK